MDQPLKLYQIKGLLKLLTFKDAIYRIGVDLNEKNKPLGHPDKFTRKTIEDFINIFCEHNLADTDYIDVQREAVGYKSLAEYIRRNKLELPAIIKCLTYFIWTDRIIEGYLISKIKDDSLDMLLEYLHDIIAEEPSMVR